MKNNISAVHVRDLVDNLKEVETLLRIHEKISGKKPGNRASVNVLNKSGIVLLVACWEAFVEDLAEASFNHLLKKAATHDVFTEKVRALASEYLLSSLDKRKIWDLAGEGWKKVLTEHKLSVISKYLGRFNTAKIEPIDELFENLIGMKSVSKHWHWQGTTNENICSRLDKLITLRGEIAHRVRSKNTVLKADVESALELIQNLAAIMSNRVRSYLFLRTRSFPWGGVKYGKRK